MHADLEIDRFGPIRDLHLRVRKGVYVVLGLPGSGKSYLLKLIFLVTRLYESPLIGTPGDVEGALKIMLKELFGDEWKDLFESSSLTIRGVLYDLTLSAGEVKVEEKATMLKPRYNSEEGVQRSEFEARQPDIDSLSVWPFVALVPPRNEMESLALLVAGLLPGANFCEVKMFASVFGGRGFGKKEMRAEAVFLPFSVFLPHGRSLVIEHYSLSQEYPMEYSEHLKLYKTMRYRFTVYPWLKGIEENKGELDKTAIVREVMMNVLGGTLTSLEGKLVFKKDNDVAKVHAAADAVKELIALASAEALAKRSHFSYFFVEEPENQLHPIAQRALVRTLSKAADVVMMSTHSPYVVIEACLASNGTSQFVYLSGHSNVLGCREILAEIPEISSVSLEQLEEVSEKWNTLTTAKS